MAEKTLKKVEDHLKCCICLDTYIDPRLLQCQHAYCHDCLTKLGQASITCPTCRRVTPIRTRRGVADLKSALHINHLLDIMGEHKQPPLSGTTADQVSGVQYCSEHTGKELELYCETCLELICLKCAVKSGKHYGHDYDELDDAFVKCKKDITSSMKSIEKKLVEVSEVLTSLEKCCEDVSNQEAAVEADINSATRRFHKLIDTRRGELLDMLHELAQSKKDRITAQRCQVEISCADLSSYLDFTKETLATVSNVDMLMMKMAIVMQVQELPTPNQRALKVGAEANMKFRMSSEVESACKNYGQILPELYIGTKRKKSPVRRKMSPPTCSKFGAAYSPIAFSLPMTTEMKETSSGATTTQGEDLSFSPDTFDYWSSGKAAIHSITDMVPDEEVKVSCVGASDVDVFERLGGMEEEIDELQFPISRVELGGVKVSGVVAGDVKVSSVKCDIVEDVRDVPVVGVEACVEVGGAGVSSVGVKASGVPDASSWVTIKPPTRYKYNKKRSVGRWN